MRGICKTAYIAFMVVLLQGPLWTPHEVFGQPSNAPVAERARLARRAVNRLAVQVDSTEGPEKTLSEARAAGLETEGIDPEVRESLETLALVAERRVLAQYLAEVRQLAAKDRWPEAAARGVERLRQLGKQSTWGLDPQAVQARKEVRQALTEAVRLGQTLENLERFQAALRAGRLGTLTAENIPGRFQIAIEGLRALRKARELAGRGPLDAARAATLKGHLEQFEKGLRTLPRGDATLVARIRQELAVQSFLEGRIDVYRTLMPADGPPDHAAKLLRDMKALALGKGEVVTWPAQRAVPAEPGKSVPPPGLKPLVSGSPRDGWRPPTRAGGKPDLPPLEKAAEAGKTLQAHLETEARAERTALEPQVKEALGRLQTVQQHLQEREQAESKCLAAVEAALTRKLRPVERLLVRQMTAGDHTTARIVAAVKRRADQDEEHYIREVVARAGRALTPDELARVRRLHHQGKEPADAVAVLRSAPKPRPEPPVDPGP